MSEIAGNPAVRKPRSRRRLGWLAAPPLVVGLAAATALIIPGQQATGGRTAIAPANAPGRSGPPAP
ncbi:hypothetical protein ACFWIQ_35615, partial [Kitasatospora sp. NPDC127059]|uniref:hypothetical protein n=1 Tax=Kitasatospora sp. NPDC127059 TaxID=3347120 RepID=UPI003648820A